MAAPGGVAGAAPAAAAGAPAPPALAALRAKRRRIGLEADRVLTHDFWQPDGMHASPQHPLNDQAEENEAADRKQ